MNFNESIKYLYDLGYELSVKKFGLGNTLKLLEAFNNPEKNYLKVQIAGTNGKGSTCAFLESICISAGLRVGKFTSPHLVSVTERIRINGSDICEIEFARQATDVKKVSEELVAAGVLAALPTFFEQVTAIALNSFAEKGVEVAILETGLGGRFDATTAAGSEIVALTSVDYDHQNILGNNLAGIASEKAAIIREDTAVVVGLQLPQALDAVLQKCGEVGVIPMLASDCPAEFSISDSKFQISEFVTIKDEYNGLVLNLRGKHQVENAKVAVLLAEILKDHFKITKEDIIAGLAAAVHPGRLEYYKNYLFDGAHNVSGAMALCDYLDEFVEKPITMIFGSMKEKDLAKIGQLLFLKAKNLILTKPDNPRSMAVSDLERFVPEITSKENVYLTDSVAEAMEIANRISRANELICVTGSLYLIGEVKKILNNEFEI